MEYFYSLCTILLFAGVSEIHSEAANNVQIKNPSFEDKRGWSNLKRDDSELHAAPDGEAFAVAKGRRAATSQKLQENVEAGMTYTLNVWARSVNPQSSSNPEGRAQVKLYSGRTTLASVTSSVSVQELEGAPQKYSNDDGGNVWIEGNYRVSAAEHFFYQHIASDPIADPWSYGGTVQNDMMAQGPVLTPEGLKALYGTMYDDVSSLSSALYRAPLIGNAPNYTVDPPWGDETDYTKILSHQGDEVPWVIDAHLAYDNVTRKLWMSWGGHVCYVTELDPETGNIIGNPSSPDFYSHPEGTHSKILVWANEEYGGTAPHTWEGDDMSSAYTEGPALFQNDGYWYAFASYGNMDKDYTIRVCRSLQPTGPYVDKNGRDCTTYYPSQKRYGASMLLGPEGNQAVPGHPHLWREGSKIFLGYDYRQELSRNRRRRKLSNDKMGVRHLHWTRGWPTIWMPLTVTFNADDFPAVIGKRMRVSLQNVGSRKSNIAFDLASITKVPTGRRLNTSFFV